MIMRIVMIHHKMKCKDRDSQEHVVSAAEIA